MRCSLYGILGQGKTVSIMHQAGSTSAHLMGNCREGGGVNFNPGAKHIQAQGKAASMWKGETEFTTPTWSHIFILYWGPQSTCFLRSYFMNINCWCSQVINRTIPHLCYDNR